jgi:catechol 2,3-dioxygenase-like lactoylglutathione lyase family enzyme
MAGPRPVFNQINIVCSNVDASLAFYRRLGVTIPEGMVWRTATGAHHVGPIPGDASDTPSIDLDSATFARLWNTGWKGRDGIAGRVVVGFGVAAREDVDRIHADMTGAGYRSLQAPYDAFFGARYAVLEDPDGLAVGLMSPISDEHRSPEIPQV